MNAKVQPGLSFRAVAGAQAMLPAEEGDGGSDTRKSGHFELDLQWGKKLGDSAIAAQLKVPVAFVLSSLDVFYQVPSNHPFYFGVGGELGAMPGFYAAATYYLNDSTFVTLTPRALRELDTEADEGSWQLSSQLAIGSNSGGGQLAGFVQYAHQTGQGFNVDINLFGDDDRDYRKDFILIGVALRR